MAVTGPLKIVIPGGSGQIGHILARHFHNQGHAATVISRKPQAAPWQTVRWNGCTLDQWTKSIDGSNVVINLAGRSVNCRYTERHRREIKESRIKTTWLIGQAIAQAPHPPSLWMNASTATIYRHALDHPMDESSGEVGGSEPNVPSSWRFSIDVATSWENTFFEAVTPGIRKIALRSAITMTPDPGGAFDILQRLVRAGLGGKTGPGDQYVSWIHEFDFIRAIEFLIEHTELAGAVNIASPNPVPNRDFMRCLRNASCTRFGLPMPRWMLTIGAVFLQTETELVLKSRWVIPARLQNAGFSFHFPKWSGAAKELVQRWRNGQTRCFEG